MRVVGVVIICFSLFIFINSNLCTDLSCWPTVNQINEGLSMISGNIVLPLSTTYYGASLQRSLQKTRSPGAIVFPESANDVVEYDPSFFFFFFFFCLALLKIIVYSSVD